LTDIFKTIVRPAVFGATGSLGRCVCRVLAREGISATHLGGYRNHDLLAALLEPSGATSASFMGTASPALAKVMAASGIGRAFDERRALDGCGSAIVVSSGLAGAEPARLAASMGIPLVLGNKEVAVGWGRLLVNQSRRSSSGCALRPIDSEHAVAAVLLARAGEQGIARLVITGTGGAVREIPPARRIDLSPARVLDHPVWRMGRKITVDSATLINKAFEVIEAAVLFDLPPEKISVRFDRDARIHAAITTADGRTLAFAGPPEMETPVRIACGLKIPETAEVLEGAAGGAAVESLRTPEGPDRRAIELGHAAIEAGGTMPMVLAVADEIAVTAFLEGRMRFGDIVPFVEYSFDKSIRAARRDPFDPADLLATEAETRQSAQIA